MEANATVALDVCGLPPPEPFERIIESLTCLPVGASLEVHIHREPHPLYEVLLDGGYRWQTTELQDKTFLISIAFSP